MLCGIALPQSDFFQLYKQVSVIAQRLDKQVSLRKDLTEKDSIEIATVELQRTGLYRNNMLPVLQSVNNMTFPDISFTDIHNKDHSISDFSNSDVIINYTYLYCMPCIRRIDSTLKRTASKNIKLLVLVSDLYKKDVSDLEQYGDKITVGLVNDENGDLLSLKQGHDSFYYLNSSRQVEFFDKAYPDHREAWLRFLDEHIK